MRQLRGAHLLRTDKAKKVLKARMKEHWYQVMHNCGDLVFHRLAAQTLMGSVVQDIGRKF